MLSLLHIENIAVIECADISFDPGFNVLTGETGAGKSIVIDAMSAFSSLIYSYPRPPTLTPPLIFGGAERCLMILARSVFHARAENLAGLFSICCLTVLA